METIVVIALHILEIYIDRGPDDFRVATNNL